MNKKVVWTIIAIVIVLALILVLTNNSKDETPSGSNELPDTTQAQYNNLATSTGNFAALDEAVNQLE